MKKYIKIWWFMTVAGTQENFSSRLAAGLLIIGKIVRFLFFFLFLLVIGSRTKLIGGYSLQQMIFFFITYQLVDTIPQFFFREVYRFRRYIVTGDFDHFLTKPFPALFRSLFGWTDALDIPMIILSVVALIIAGMQFHGITFLHVIMYLALIVNAFFISLAFHIGVLALAVVTTEVDSAIMFYRDLTSMGRIPVNIYKEPLKGFLTFIIPIGIMMAFPVQALFGLLSIQFIILAFLFSMTFVFVAIKLWYYALRSYASASS